MIGTSSFIGIGVMAAGGVLLPLAVCVWWLIAKKEKLTTVLVGAATWLVFALLLESLPKLLLFRPATALGRTILGSPALYAATGALLAGLFEETGRFLAFKTLLRKRTNRETAISHGIGHGGFEALFILGVTGIQYLAYAVMINTGAFSAVIDQAAAAGADVSALEALPAQLMTITPTSGVLGLAERGFAMLLHAALSILVFYSVRGSRLGLYPLAILLHALMDVPAVLYQLGILGLYVVEAFVAVYSIACFVIVYRCLYKRDRE